MHLTENQSANMFNEWVTGRMHPVRRSRECQLWKFKFWNYSEFNKRLSDIKEDIIKLIFKVNHIAPAN